MRVAQSLTNRSDSADGGRQMRRIEQGRQACPHRAHNGRDGRSLPVTHGSSIPPLIRQEPSHSLVQLVFQAGHASSILVTRSTSRKPTAQGNPRGRLSRPSGRRPDRAVNVLPGIRSPVLHDLAEPGRDRAGLTVGARRRHAVEGDDHSVRRRLTYMLNETLFLGINAGHGLVPALDPGVARGRRRRAAGWRRHRLGSGPAAAARSGPMR